MQDHPAIVEHMFDIGQGCRRPREAVSRRRAACSERDRAGLLSAQHAGAAITSKTSCVSVCRTAGCTVTCSSTRSRRAAADSTATWIR